MRSFTVIIILAFFSLLSPGVMLGEEGPVKLSTSMERGFTELVSNAGHFQFEAAVDIISLIPGEAGDPYFSIGIPAYYSQGEPGSPELPGTSLLFEASGVNPDQIRIELLDSVIFNLDSLGVTGMLRPVHPPVRKGDTDPGLWFNSAVYERDAWLGGPVVEVEYQGRMRGLDMSLLTFNPVRYNPVRKQLKVYSRVRCTIETGPLQREAGLPDRAFSNLSARVVRQYPLSRLKAVEAEEAMTLVILTDTLFRDALRPFVEWKTRKGFRVLEVYRHDSLAGGTRESMKAYLESLYRSPPPGIAPPTYLLIVGDVEHIPLSQATGQVTDLYYATYDGEGDYIPDLFYGRISVASSNQLTAVLQKILEYEQHLFPDPSFLGRSVLIAGVDGNYASTYGNGQINYAGAYYLNRIQGREAHLFPYPESDTSSEVIIDLVSKGVGFVNYTGHGLTDRWEAPAFRISDIDRLQNKGMYPVMIGNGCETNVFSLKECFAEALLRAPGKGALAYIGCTNDSYWDEDYYWAVGAGPVSSFPTYGETARGYYDKVFHSHDEAHELWTPSLGEMIFGGNMAVQQSRSHRKQFYWEIYQLAGDPSIVPWFGPPAEQQVLYPAIIPSDAQRLDIRCAPYTYVALSRDKFLLEAKHADKGGYVTLWLSDTLSSGNLDLVLTADAYQPWTGQIQRGGESGFYLDLLDYHISGESVVKDGLLTPGEEASLSLRLINRGEEAIRADTLQLISDQGIIHLSDSLQYLSLLDPGDTLLLPEVFRFYTAPGTADQTRVVMGIVLSGGGTPIYISELVHGPKLVSKGISWDDRPKGNGNGIPEAGELLLCRWTLLNSGHFRTGEISGREMEADRLPNIFPGEEKDLLFTLKMPELWKGSILTASFSAGNIHCMLTDSFTLAVGHHFEDFSGEDYSSYPFENISEEGWWVDVNHSVSPPASLRSGRISHSQNTALSLVLHSDEDDTLSFSYRLSSEPLYDYLDLIVDSVVVESWSGEKPWERYELFLEKGSHEILWSYRKDENTDRGEDAAWIDDIMFPASAFRKGDLSLMEIVSRDAAPWDDGPEKPGIRIRNTSSERVEGFTTRFFLDAFSYAEETSTSVLLPGEEVLITPFAGLRLPGTGTYVFSAEIVDSSGYRGNNSMEKSLVRYGFPDLALTGAREDQDQEIYANALITIENTGNVRIDSAEFGVWLDERILSSDVRYMGVAPGDSREEVFRLVNPGDQLSFGTHEYLVRMLSADSTLHNNEQSGSLDWYPLGFQSIYEPATWTVSPNPARVTIQIHLAKPAGEELVFELLSISGQLLGKYVMEKGTNLCLVPAPTTGPGLYLLRMVESGKSIRVVLLP